MSPGETLLDELNEISTVVPETAKLDVIRKLGSTHVSLSTSQITAAAQQPEHHELVDAAVSWAQKKVGKGGIRRLVATRAVERLPVEFGLEILNLISGHISVELDGRLAHKRRGTVERARALMEQFEEAGIDRERVLMKIPATWEGIEAAQKLRSKSGIRCHMTLVFGMHQLAACAEAGAAVISPSVGRITDWHKKREKVEEYPIERDPGVLAALQMKRYLEQHHPELQLMGSMFRKMEQAAALAHTGPLCLPYTLIESLETSEPLTIADFLLGVTTPEEAPKLALDRSSFEAMHNADPLSSSKLAAGVKNLSWALVSQEQQLVDWIIARQDEVALSSTTTLFATWDYDGDGYIDREEWAGTDEVFKALDRDNDGRISLEEMAIGLGAPKPTED